jgi:hypothetical protein
LRGIKIHFRKFLYDFALKRNKLLGKAYLIFGLFAYSAFSGAGNGAAESGTARVAPRKKRTRVH